LYCTSADAERIVAEELERQGWQEADLLANRKNNAVEIGIALRMSR